MSHIRSKIRNAVISRLKTLPSLDDAYPSSRSARKFQKNEFPAALVAVSEGIQLSDNNPPGHRVFQRDFTIAISVAVSDATADAETVLDDVCVDIEKALIKSSDVDAGGGLMFWQYQGTGPMTPEPTEDGLLMICTMTYTCSVLSIDSQPDTFLHASN